MIAGLADYAAPFARWRTWFLMGNQDVYLRYKRSIIGPFWLSLTMLATILGIGLLYSLIFKQEFRSFLIFFACGILAWQLLVGLLLDGCTAVSDSEAHLRSIPIPITVLAARSVYRNLIIFLHNAIAVAAMLLVFGHMFAPISLLAILGLSAYFTLGFFWSVAMSPLSTRFRDIPQVVASITQIAFFLTPIFWRPEFTSERPVVTVANPFYHLIEIVRAPLLGAAPTALNWQVTIAILVIAAFAAVAVNAYARKRVFVWL